MRDAMDLLLNRLAKVIWNLSSFAIKWKGEHSDFLQPQNERKDKQMNISSGRAWALSTDHLRGTVSTSIVNLWTIALVEASPLQHRDGLFIDRCPC